MKLWQLLAVLEKSISDKYFATLDPVANGRTDIDENEVLAALSESKLEYYVTSDNYLRLMPEDPYALSHGKTIVEILSVLNTYKKFGANAITEVVDYGCYELFR